MNIKLSFAEYSNCYIKIQKYSNGQPALVIYQDGEVLLKASVNVQNYIPPKGFICIKNWSENEGILESLIENQVIDPPQVFIPSGFVEVPVCKLKGAYNEEQKEYSSLV